MEKYDLAVIGGGINGAGIACDAAGRGLSTLLVEAEDLASATSSASSKLIHGGLRYLEHGAFRLVRESLTERDILLAKAPHIVWPLEFILPHDPTMRPRWMIRLGLFLYDHLGRSRHIPSSRAVALPSGDSVGPLSAEHAHGFAYWDCWVDDARLVVLNARAAAAKGATVKTRMRFVEAHQEQHHWLLRLKNRETGEQEEARARAVVNAAGPWSEGVLHGFASADRDHGNAAVHRLRQVKGSHIVVPAMTDGEAYILQNDDDRVIFVLPFERSFSLIGTTDIPFEGDASDAAASETEVDYLLDAVNRYAAAPLHREDIVWDYAGVRPLYDDGSSNLSKVTRDYHLELSGDGTSPPVLSVFGGKITTYRALAEEVLDRLGPWFPNMGPPWTADAKLPGGDIGTGTIRPYVSGLQQTYPNIDSNLLYALARRHGSLTTEVLGDAKVSADLGEDFGGFLTAREVIYLKDREWARRPEDVLWRRTKAGLHMTSAQRPRAEDGIAKLL